MSSFAGIPRFLAINAKINGVFLLILMSISRFGIEKPVRVCDSCYEALQGLRASPSRNSNRRVTFEDEQAWQNNEAAALAHYAKRSQQKEAKAASRQKAKDEVKIIEELICKNLESKSPTGQNDIYYS